MGTLHGDQYTSLIISRLVLRMINVSDMRYRKQNTHFVFNEFFFRKSCRLFDNVEKCSRAGESTDDSLVHVHFTLGT